MLLSILQCIGQPPTTKDYSIRNVSGAKVEKPCSKYTVLVGVSLKADKDSSASWEMFPRSTDRGEVKGHRRGRAKRVTSWSPHQLPSWAAGA